jgi:cytochrome P450
LVSALIAAHEDGDRLTEEEIHATRLLFVAGYENANNLIGNGTFALLRHPGQWEQLRQDPGLAGGAVEEILRNDAPFQFTRRVAAADLEIGGYQIERSHHLAIGSGIHACFGGPLARLEGETAFTTLARRLIDPRLENDTPRYRTDVFRSFAELPITFSGIR